MQTASSAGFVVEEPTLPGSVAGDGGADVDADCRRVARVEVVLGAVAVTAVLAVAPAVPAAVVGFLILASVAVVEADGVSRAEAHVGVRSVCLHQRQLGTSAASVVPPLASRLRLLPSPGYGYSPSGALEHP